MKKVVMLLTGVASIFLLTACGGSNMTGESLSTVETISTSQETESSGSTQTPSASSEGIESTSASDSKSGEKTKVSIALNYTLGCDHGGLMAAKDLGYFDEAGIEVDIVPWSSQTRAESLVSAGTVNIAYVASIDDALLNMAAHRPITAITAILQTDPTWIGYLADSDIKRPRDLDGKTYGSWGSAKEELLMKALIESDGGKGEFTNVLLGTSAFEAVYNGQVDAALFYSYSDTINAELKDHKLNYFKFSDIDSIPKNEAIVICANNQWLSKNQDTAKAFISALKKGYEYQLNNVDKTVQFLYDNGCTGDKDYETQSMEQFNTLMKNENGELFKMDLDTWNKRADFWVKQKFLVDENDNVLTEAPDLSGYVTNDYIAD